MRRKKAILTFVTSIFLQIILMITNFILPHFIILNYGSEINGLINSITKFLSYISLFEAGIGGVITALLYKPLAKKDNDDLSVIVVSTLNFFRKISFILIIYVIALCILYPLLIEKSFDNWYIILLIIIIALNNFASYFFGLINQLLLKADQKGYVVNICQSIMILISTIIMIYLIVNKQSIHIVKIFGTLIMMIPPIFYYLYVKKNYIINWNVLPSKKVISKRWDGFSHQLAAFVHTNTDIAILTIFSSLNEVSVYAVYSMVTSGLKSIITTLTTSISAAFGSLYAKGEIDKLVKQFEIFNYFNIIIIYFVFSIAGLLITPFVKIYVGGANDANYVRELFGVLLILSEAVYLLRCIYSTIISVVGHYRETKIHAYIECLLNLLLSIVLIKPFGLVGIAIGTLCGMLIRLVLSFVYVDRKIINYNKKEALKIYFVNTIAVIVFLFISLKIYNFNSISNISSWIVAGILNSILLLFIMFVFNYVFLKKNLKEVYNEYFKKIFKLLRKN